MGRIANFAITVVVCAQIAWTQSLTEAKEHSARGTEFFRQANFVAAEQEYRLALDYAHKLGKPGLSEYTSALSNVAASLQSQGRLKEARQALEECVFLEKAFPQPRGTTMAHALNNLAIIAHTDADLTQAIALLRRSSLLPTDDRTKAGTLHNLASMYMELGQWSTVEKLLNQAIPLYRKAGAIEELSPALAMIAKLAVRNRDYARAESLFQEALELRIQVFGATHPNVALTLCEIAEFQNETKRYDAAIETLERGLRYVEASLGAEHIYSAALWFQYGQTKRKQEKHEDALVAYERAIRILQKNYGPEHARLAFVYRAAAASSAKLKRKQEAKEYEARALALIQGKVDWSRHTVDVSAFLPSK